MKGNWTLLNEITCICIIHHYHVGVHGEVKCPNQDLPIFQVRC